MTIGTFPPHKTNALLEINMSKNKPAYPDFLKRIHNWGTQPVNGRYRRITVYECPEDKLYQGMLALTKRYNFYAQIEGYTFEILPLISEEDSMKIAQAK
jgi:hypothetical protein